MGCEVEQHVPDILDAVLVVIVLVARGEEALVDGSTRAGGAGASGNGEDGEFVAVDLMQPLDSLQLAKLVDVEDEVQRLVGTFVRITARIVRRCGFCGLVGVVSTFDNGCRRFPSRSCLG